MTNVEHQSEQRTTGDVNMNSKRTPTRLSGAILLARSVIAAGPSADADADHNVILQHGENARVDGSAVTGINVGHFAGTDETYPCGDDPAATCRTILVEVTNPYGDAVKKGRERATLSLQLDGQGLGDAALLVYESDADGDRGSEVASSDNLGTLADEGTDLVVTTTEAEQTRWYLVEVFFHGWAGTWGLDASFA